MVWRHRYCPFFGRSGILIFQDYTHSPNHFWLKICNGIKTQRWENSSSPLSHKLLYCSYSHSRNLWLHYMPAGCLRNLPVSHQCTLQKKSLQHFSLSTQHDARAHSETWTSLGLLAEALKGMLPFYQHLFHGSSIPPLCRAIILGRGPSVMYLHCLQLACRAGIPASAAL